MAKEIIRKWPKEPLIRLSVRMPKSEWEYAKAIVGRLHQINHVGDKKAGSSLSQNEIVVFALNCARQRLLSEMLKRGEVE